MNATDLINKSNQEKQHAKITALSYMLCKNRSCPSNLEVDAKYRIIRNDCWGFNNLSYTIHLG